MSAPRETSDPLASPASDPRLLRAGDPAELLAQMGVLLREEPRDCIGLIGHRGRREVVLGARLPFASSPGSWRQDEVRPVLDALLEKGCEGAFGLVIQGDGYEPAQSVEAVEHARAAAIALIRAAERPTARSFDLPEVWVLTEGRAVRMRTAIPGAGRAGSSGLRIDPPVPLGPLEDTLVQAQSVLAGEMQVRGARGGDPLVGAVRAALFTRASPPPDRPRGEPRPDVASSWRRTVRALDALRADLGHPGRPARSDRRLLPDHACVSPCDAIEELVRGLASTARRDRFLALVVAHGRGSGTPPGLGPVETMMCGTQRPAASIRAGGRWYEAMSLVLAAARPEPGARADQELAAGWANLACVQALCAWWDHRYATAGRLADEVLEREPRHVLARWIVRLVDIPIPPGWDVGPAR